MLQIDCLSKLKNLECLTVSLNPQEEKQLSPGIYFAFYLHSGTLGQSYFSIFAVNGNDELSSNNSWERCSTIIPYLTGADAVALEFNCALSSIRNPTQNKRTFLLIKILP